MFVRKRIIQAKRRRHRARRFCGLSIKDMLAFFSSLIVPLIFGIITVVITLHEQKQGDERWKEERWADNNKSQLQRELDWNISRSNQDAQSKAVSDRYQDELLVTYIKESGDMLKENNGSLTTNSLTQILARVKTLNLLRQLDGSRQLYVIRFLCETQQLTNTNKSKALDISTAELRNVNFHELDPFLDTGEISFAGVFFRNCTFSRNRSSQPTLKHVSFSSAWLFNVNFPSGWLYNVKFSDAQLEDVNFSSTWLYNVNFLDARLKDIIFSSLDLDNVNFSSVELNNVSFSFVELHNVHFSSSGLYNVNFSSANFYRVNFSSARRLYNVSFSSAYLAKVDFSSTCLENVNFSDTRLKDIIFSSVDLDNVNFSSAELYNVNFSSANFYNVNFSSARRLYNVSFSSAYLSKVDFSSVNLTNVDFSSVNLTNVDFSFADLYNINFSFADLYNVNFSSARFSIYTVQSFHYARMPYTRFEKCLCEKTDFSGAHLRDSSFHSAKLSNANFYLANLQEVDLTNTSITDSQLQSALSIRNAKLPNGTLARGHNLVRNGDANCNISLLKHWQIQNGKIAVMASKEDRNQCQFSLQSLTTEAIMSRRINLEHVWDSSIWTNSRVELQAHMSSGVSIKLNGKASNGTVLNKKVAISTENKISIRLEKDMQEIEVVVKFNTYNNKSNNEHIWCDNIELFIDYDIL